MSEHINKLSTFRTSLRAIRVRLSAEYLTEVCRRLIFALCALIFDLGKWALRLRMRMQRKQPVRRSLWAGTPILTIAGNARAESLLGVKAETLVWQTYFITHEFTYDLSKWRGYGPDWLQYWLPQFVVLWAAYRYQRFHFFCDRMLTPFGIAEDQLALLRSLDKEVFFWTYGADVRTEARTRALGEPNCCTDCPEPGHSCICSEELHQQNYGRIAKYATAVFSMGDMIEYTPGSYNQTFFWPLDLAAEHGRRYEPHYPDPASSAPVRILHAPNHRGFKGSQYLIAAVEKLRKEGLSIELVLVEKVPNRQALELYRTADIVFDQCLIGFHGYFALEAMALGKPVMVYIRDPERYLLAPDECPFINAHRDKIEPLLRELVFDRPRLRELGVQGRKYIEKYFTFSAFAARLKLAYQETGLQSYKESLRAWNATSSGRETTEIESALNARGNAA